MILNVQHVVQFRFVPQIPQRHGPALVGLSVHLVDKQIRTATVPELDDFCAGHQLRNGSTTRNSPGIPRPVDRSNFAESLAHPSELHLVELGVLADVDKDGSLIVSLHSDEFCRR
jgi:hypothetical protein